MSNSVFNEDDNTWRVNECITFKDIHPKTKCVGQNCIVHNPSDTIANQQDWPYSFREGGAGGRIERICPCGVGHSDEDQVAFLQAFTGQTHWGVHGCCGCCSRKDEDG